MKVFTHIGRIAVGLAAAALAVGVPVAGATDDGSLLSRASRQAIVQPVTVNPGLVTDGTLLSRASRSAAIGEVARINPGRVTDGMLLTEASLLHQLAQLDPGRGTGESIVSETAAARNAAVQAQASRTASFHWGDAAAGFGLAAFAASFGAAVVWTRRRGSLVHVP